MAFAPGGDAEEMAEGVVGHWRLADVALCLNQPRRKVKSAPARDMPRSGDRKYSQGEIFC
jgi:hypothetical protein